MNKNINLRIVRHNEEIFKLATNIEMADLKGDEEKANHLTHRMRLHQLALARLEIQNHLESEKQ